MLEAGLVCAGVFSKMVSSLNRKMTAYMHVPVSLHFPGAATLVGIQHDKHVTYRWTHASYTRRLDFIVALQDLREGSLTSRRAG